MKRRLQRSGQGFGLIELMIALTLGLFLVLGVSQVFLASKRSFTVQQHTAALQENARFVLTRISRDLRQAGMFGCLDLARLPAATRNQLPADFGQPVSFNNGVLSVVTAVPAHTSAAASDNRKPSDYGAHWLLASNCLNELRIASGGVGLAIDPGDIIIAVRKIEYRLDQHRIQTRINGVGNFETLIDNVAGFDVQLGLAAAVTDRTVSGNYVTNVAAAASGLIRSVRIALQLSDNPSSAATGEVKVQEYTLVTALRNRLD